MKLKPLIKNIWVYYLTFLAKVYLNNIKPKVIVITGSVGKTSLKDFLVLAFKKHGSVVYSKKSYNSETGVPLAVFQIEDNHDFESLLKIVFVPLYKLLFSCEKFNYLILEKDVQMPGEMNELAFMTKVDCGVLLNVFLTHTQFFKREEILQQIFEEFAKISGIIKKEGALFINLDSHTVLANYNGGYFKKFSNVLPISEGKVGKFGYKGTWYLNKIEIETRNLKYEIHKKLPKEYVQTFGIGISVCEFFKISGRNIKEALREFDLQPGRFTFLEGQKGCEILDSSYNCSPASLKSFLEYLKAIPEGKYKRKIVCLGEMRELGEASEKEHKKLLPLINSCADTLLLVGTEMRDFVFPNTAYDKDHIRLFENSVAMGEFLQPFVRKGDLVVFKGSQNTIFLEEAIKMVLKNKSDISRLCRQENYWTSIKKKYFKCYTGRRI